MEGKVAAEQWIPRHATGKQNLRPFEKREEDRFQHSFPKEITSNRGVRLPRVRSSSHSGAPILTSSPPVVVAFFSARQRASRSTLASRAALSSCLSAVFVPRNASIERVPRIRQVRFFLSSSRGDRCRVHPSFMHESVRSIHHPSIHLLIFFIFLRHSGCQLSLLFESLALDFSFSPLLDSWTANVDLHAREAVADVDDAGERPS